MTTASSLVRPDDVAAARDVLADLADHPETIARMSADGLRRVEHMTWEKASRRIADVAGPA